MNLHTQSAIPSLRSEQLNHKLITNSNKIWTKQNATLKSSQQSSVKSHCTKLIYTQDPQKSTKETVCSELLSNSDVTQCVTVGTITLAHPPVPVSSINFVSRAAPPGQPAQPQGRAELCSGSMPRSKRLNAVCTSSHFTQIMQYKQLNYIYIFNSRNQNWMNAQASGNGGLTQEDGILSIVQLFLALLSLPPHNFHLTEQEYN